MNRIEKRMAELKAANKKGIYVYITCGAPDVATTLHFPPKDSF